MLGVGDTRRSSRRATVRDGRSVPVTSAADGWCFLLPKAFTAGCTEEIRHFRDNQARIRALGGELVGVSVDRPEVQCQFAQSEKIEYPLLGDSDRKISEKFGVLWPLVRINRRVTFVVSPEGRIEEVISHERQVWRHLDDVIAALERRVGAAAPVDATQAGATTTRQGPSLSVLTSQRTSSPGATPAPAVRNGARTGRQTSTALSGSRTVSVTAGRTAQSCSASGRFFATSAHRSTVRPVASSKVGVPPAYIVPAGFPRRRARGP